MWQCPCSYLHNITNLELSTGTYTLSRLWRYLHFYYHNYFLYKKDRKQNEYILLLFINIYSLSNIQFNTYILQLYNCYEVIKKKRKKIVLPLCHLQCLPEIDQVMYRAEYIQYNKQLMKQPGDTTEILIRYCRWKICYMWQWIKKTITAS